MTKKILHQVSDQDLLDILDEVPDSTPNVLITTKTDVLDFIYALRITKGENKVTTSLLYKLYRNWSKDPVPRQTFSREVGLLIETGNVASGACFKINLDENTLLKKTVEYTKKTDKTKRKPDKRHFDNYLNRYEIKKGSFFVKDLVLFNLYDKWTYENKKPHSLSLVNFNKFCQLYFKPYKVIESRFWYGLDSSIIKYFTEEMKKQMVIREKRKYQRSQIKQKIR